METEIRTLVLTFDMVAERAGFVKEADGKLKLPAVQDTADKLAAAAAELVGEWLPGDRQTQVTLTGAGPVWGHLAIGHALHGRVVRLDYAAPNAPLINIFTHDAPAA